MSKQIDPTLSVIIPTYNCRKLIERHVENLIQWADLAYEIIIVDSRSNDGTLEYLKDKLIHPRIKIIERDRGLYESWNAGIACTVGKWIYISTAGDTISRGHLELLLQSGEINRADVVISPQCFVDENGDKLPAKIKIPRANIYRGLRHKLFYRVSPEGTSYFAFLGAKPNALLGSCASDLFRGDHLRSRPFPTEYESHGDTAWILRYANESTILIVNEIGSNFCIHEKEQTNSPKSLHAILDRMLTAEAVRCKNSHIQATFQLIRRIRSLVRTRRDAWHADTLSGKKLWLLINFEYLYLKLKLSFLNIKYRVSRLEKIIVRV